MEEKLTPKDSASASLCARNVLAERADPPHFTFEFECFDREGNLKWRETVRNTVVTDGKNSLLDIYFDAAAQITTWYLGLKGAGTVAAGDTLASHAGWSELSSYTGNRGAITWGEPSSGSLAASSAVSFAITGSMTVAGAFIASAATGTVGVLYSAGDFSASRSVVNGDTLNVTPTVSF